MGRLGLDMARKVTRSAAWLDQELGPIRLLNECSPWYPETAGYAVCCIKDGMLELSVVSVLHCGSSMY